MSASGLKVLDELRRSLNDDAEALDRQGITHWLMMFASGKPLKLRHPRMGDIRYDGVQFEGSPIASFDRYVTLCIEDLVAKHVSQVEVALADVPTAELEDVAAKAGAAITGKRAALLGRAQEIKARLLRVPDHSGRPSAVYTAGDEIVPVTARLDAMVRTLKAERSEREPRPVSRRLERFWKANPALTHILTGGLGWLIGVLTARLL